MQSSKQFLIDRILDQAKIEAVLLTNIEIRMLKFTEATSESRDLEAAEVFERDYNDEEYELKIANLIRHVYARDQQSGNKPAWADALANVAGRDLYLNVMIDRAGLNIDPLASLKDWRFLLYGLLPPALCLAAAVLVALSPIGARFIPSDLLRFLIAICFLGAPWLLLRRSKSRRVPKRKAAGR
jgi:hypothetical protein